MMAGSRMMNEWYTQNKKEKAWYLLRETLEEASAVYDLTLEGGVDYDEGNRQYMITFRNDHVKMGYFVSPFDLNTFGPAHLLEELAWPTLAKFVETNDQREPLRINSAYSKRHNKPKYSQYHTRYKGPGKPMLPPKPHGVTFNPTTKREQFDTGLQTREIIEAKEAADESKRSFVLGKVYPESRGIYFASDERLAKTLEDYGEIAWHESWWRIRVDRRYDFDSVLKVFRAVETADDCVHEYLRAIN